MAGLPSMNRGSFVPFVPTYPIWSRKSRPRDRWTFKYQSCVYGSGRFGVTVKFVRGVENWPSMGGLPLKGSAKLKKGDGPTCGVCKNGGALIGDCNGPPWPV